MFTIFIENKPYEIKEGRNLLQACLSLGFDLPYFCWHPAMHSVGACRQCAVKHFKDEKDTRGRIVMSCMTPVSDGLRISIDDPEAKAFRSSVIEWLMLNHPHDCPVCDEGGECHLQDMTVMTGHNTRRTRFKKRTHRNQDLGPFINHEMNRCIACYRCVRFYRDHAGGRDLNVFGSHDHVYFGRHEDGVLESEFSGNLVEICPTGVFTDKTLKQHYTRKWDLQTAPSICVHCSLGCNIIVGERYGSLRRILNRYNHDVNGYFLCDRGRFGYEFVNSNRRIKKPLLRISDQPDHAPMEKETALKRIAGILSASKTVVGIGSPRASLEANFSLRELVGPASFYSGMSSREHRLVSLITDILQKGPARAPSLNDVENADAVLVLGEDVTNTAPLLDLALRRSARNLMNSTARNMRIPAWDANAVQNAAQNAPGSHCIVSPARTKIDDIAAFVHHAAPDDIARFGFAIAHELDPRSPSVSDLPDEVLIKAKNIALVLKNAERPAILSGTSLHNDDVIRAAANVAWSLRAIGVTSTLGYALPECNTMGLGLLKGNNLADLPKQEIDALIILENDLYRRADRTSVDDLLHRAKNVVVIDHLFNPTTAQASIVLPAATFAEASGSLVNNEGRCQRYYQVFKPQFDIQESWKWIRDIMRSTGKSVAAAWNTLDEITRDFALSLPFFQAVQNIAPPADFRMAGRKIPRQPHRYSGRTSMLANVDVHEPKPAEDPDTPLAYSMEGFEGSPPAPLISRYWTPGWNSGQALNKFQQEVGGPLQGGDPGMRLIEPGETGTLACFSTIPQASERALTQAGFPTYHIFGSEELSMYAPGIIERAKLRKLPDHDE